MKNQAEMPRGLGIIAGGGDLPGKVAAAAAAAGRSVFILGLEGAADAAVLAPWPHEYQRIGRAGRIIAALREHGCQDLVMIGPVRRPSLLDLRPDAEGTKILARVGRAIFAGDDGLLAAVIKVFAEEGFSVIGAHEMFREALAPAGVLTRVAPDASAMADINRGVEVARVLGAADVGQGCVVQQGLVLAVEAVEGTDAMLARAATLRRAGLRRGPGEIGEAGPGPPRRLADHRPRDGAQRRRRRAAGACFRSPGHHSGRPRGLSGSGRRCGVFLIGLDRDLRGDVP